MLFKVWRSLQFDNDRKNSSEILLLESFLNCKALGTIRNDVTPDTVVVWDYAPVPGRSVVRISARAYSFGQDD